MVGRVADSGYGKHGDKDDEGMDQSGNREGSGAERNAYDQHVTGADTVDQKSGGRLQHRRYQIECGQRQPEVGVAHAVVRAHEGEQRRQDHHIIMAHEVSRADRRDHAHFAEAMRGN